MITIRPSLPADAEAITRIYFQSAEHHAALDPERYFIPAREPIVARYRQTRANGSITLVADMDNEVVGFAELRIDSSPDPMHRAITYCHIVEIAVSASHQSQGIGEQLLQAAEAWGIEQGATFASLEYLTANTRAAAFYQERMGFHPAATIAIKRL